MSKVHLFIIYFLVSKLFILSMLLEQICVYVLLLIKCHDGDLGYMRDSAEREANMIIYHDFVGSCNSQLHVVEIHY
jgi:hypothetical protein